MTCTATFTHCTDNPVSTGFVRYATIREPYDLFGPTILLTVTAAHLMGDLDLDRSSVTQVILNGGYNCGLTAQVDYTYIDGRILVIYGQLILDRIVIL